MRETTAPTAAERNVLLGRASVLAGITVVYNLVEGLVSVAFGLEDETLALFGFGLDSFVEVVSGLGIWHMVRRMRRAGPARALPAGPDRFEARALRITGTAFYILAGGLSLTAAVNVITRHAPETTFWGVVVATVSILTMWALLHHKVKVGKGLESDAILADAGCTRACLYLSVVLLVSSAGYELTGIGGLDSAGALFIAWFSFREGREAFEKAAGKTGCSCGHSGKPCC